MNEKKHEKFEMKVYSFIIKYFETHTDNREGAFDFLLKCMGRLDKLNDEDIIDNSITLFTHYLGNNVFMDTYNTFGVPLDKLTNGDRKVFTGVLHQEFIVSHGV